MNYNILNSDGVNFIFWLQKRAFVRFSLLNCPWAPHDSLCGKHIHYLSLPVTHVHQYEIGSPHLPFNFWNFVKIAWQLILMKYLFNCTWTISHGFFILDWGLKEITLSGIFEKIAPKLINLLKKYFTNSKLNQYYPILIATTFSGRWVGSFEGFVCWLDSLSLVNGSIFLDNSYCNKGEKRWGNFLQFKQDNLGP